MWQIIRISVTYPIHAATWEIILFCYIYNRIYRSHIHVLRVQQMNMWVLYRSHINNKYLYTWSSTCCHHCHQTIYPVIKIWYNPNTKKKTKQEAFIKINLTIKCMRLLTIYEKYIIVFKHITHKKNSNIYNMNTFCFYFHIHI